MRLRTLLLFLAAATLACVSSSDAQIINSTVPAPSNVETRLSRQSLNAGETVTVTLTLDAPAPRPLSVRAQFNSTTDNVFVDMAFGAGSSTVTGQLAIPKDLDGGDYVMTQLIIMGRKWTNLPAAPQTLHIVPATKPIEVLPSKAIVALELDQEQFIRMQSEPLVTIRDTLITKLDRDASSTPATTAALLDALKQADALIPAVKSKYVVLYKTKPVPLLEPVFFEDFHRSYQAAIIELSAPAAALELPDGHPHLVNVQQVKHRPTRPDQDWNDHTLAGTYPLAAMAVIELISRNISAYLLISETGLDTFSVRLASVPSGAAIFYKRIGEPYTPLSKPTDVASATFPYAMWTFKFEKEGCKTIERAPNPYIEEHPELTVELVCKVK